MTSLPEAGSWASSQRVRRLSSATASQITASRAHHSSTFDKSIVKLSAFKCVMSQSCRFSMLCLICRLTPIVHTLVSWLLFNGLIVFTLL